jgi:hypothetical protein
MDAGGEVDPGKKNRRFALWVPMPGTIVPWHPIQTNVSGNDSPFDPSKNLYLPVGYTFVYDKTPFADVQIICPRDVTKNWNPKVAPYPGQSSADLTLCMLSSLDMDDCHESALLAFGVIRDMLQGVNPGKRLDLTLKYVQDGADCLAQKAAARTKATNKMNEIRGRVGRTGTDCKAAVIEITGVSDKVKLGT